MRDIDTYVVDNLFLLVGENPLPNYVAARCLARVTTRLFLVFSDGTEDQRDTLTAVLRQAEYSNLTPIRVEEANPHNIRARITQHATSLSGTTGLHYTGGTKAMAVHAYHAIRQVTDGHTVSYSYLDARKLRMWIEDTQGSITSFPVGLAVPVAIQTLLELHKRADLRQDMREAILWQPVVEALVRLYGNPRQARTWSTWSRNTLRTHRYPYKFLPPAELRRVTTDTFPFPVVQQALQQAVPDLHFPASFQDLLPYTPFTAAREPLEDLARWLEGSWLEDYVCSQLHAIADTLHLHDLVMNIVPQIGSPNRERVFEFDVAGMRGYQLFAFSCTTSGDRKLCKSKLLEAVARARQLGGSEARVSLVCCFENPRDLQEEVDDLVGEQQVRVFGRQHLLPLRRELTRWIQEASE